MLSRSQANNGFVCKWHIATMALVCHRARFRGWPARGAQYEGELTAKRRLLPGGGSESSRRSASGGANVCAEFSRTGGVRCEGTQAFHDRWRGGCEQ